MPPDSTIFHPLVAPDPEAVPVWRVQEGSFAALPLSEAARAFAVANGFAGQGGRVQPCPGPDGRIEAVLCGAELEPFAAGRLATILPAGRYRLAGDWPAPELAALGWALSAYRFSRYRAPFPDGPRLCLPEGVEEGGLRRIAEAVFLGRDLVNTPANDLGPDALEAAATAFAGRVGATVTAVRGDALREGFPLIHAVGQAASEPPRLVDIRWGDPAAPAVTVVGKGVTFDTGGLDIKPESGMALMKKDMAGAATALALAAMVTGAGLPIRLRVLLPIVENSIAGPAFRPGDVYRSRKGPTVEVGNTDAEGRLILADALALACEERPALLVDLATLTGAARVALGPDLPPFYTDDEGLAREIAAASAAVHDPVWRMPLWSPYDALLAGKVADLSNVSAGPFAGSVTAALFLRRFVEPGVPWVHFDIFGWTPAGKPGRPEGGEVQAARLLFRLLADRYAP